MILRMRQVCCHPQLIAVCESEVFILLAGSRDLTLPIYQYAANDLEAPSGERVIGEPIDDGEGGGNRGGNDIVAATSAMGPEMVKKVRIPPLLRLPR